MALRNKQETKSLAYFSHGPWETWCSNMVGSVELQGTKNGRCKAGISNTEEWEGTVIYTEKNEEIKHTGPSHCKLHKALFK